MTLSASRAAFGALIFFGFLAFFNAVRHPFVHDDVVFILKNPHISDLAHWYGAFSMSPASGDVNAYYRPVLEILYRAEYRVFGTHPAYYHLFNIIVHITNGLLLFGLLLKISLSARVAWLTALFFLIHPLQTESVSCIAGISNLWMALGVLLTLHAYFDKRYILGLVFFLMAFLSKEQGILALPLIMVIDYSHGKKDMYGWALFTAAACLLLWLREMVTGVSLFKAVMVSPGELCLRLAAIPRDIEMYLRLIVCPYDLHYYRSTDILQPQGSAWGLVLLLIAGIVCVFIRWPWARMTVTLGVGWFLAALLPVLNISPLINEYSFILTAEHFLYLPIAGILILLAVGAEKVLKRFRKALLGLAVGVCLLMTWHQNTFWGSEIILFERMLAFEPQFGRGHLLLAKACYFNGRHSEASLHFEKAYVIMSAYAGKATNELSKKFYISFIKEILFDWAQNDTALGQWPQALDKYKRAAMMDAKDPSLFNNIAFVYWHMGRKKEAIASLRQALQADPGFTQARRNLQQLTAL